MSQLSDFITKNEQLFNKANEGIVQGYFRPVKSVYIDLALLKDTRLGAMVSLSDNESLQYLKDGIARYNNRPNRKFTYAYPDFKYSEEYLQQYYHDPKNSEQIFNYSPDTDLSISIRDLVLSYRSVNIRAGYNDTIKFCINIYPLQKTLSIKVYQKMLNLMMHDVATFDIVSLDPKANNAITWTKYNVLFIDDLEYALQEGNALYNALFINQSLTQSSIFTPYCCADSVLEKWKQYNIKFDENNMDRDLFKVTEYLLTAFCTFTFMRFMIPAS